MSKPEDKTRIVDTMHQGPPLPPPYPQEGALPPGSSHTHAGHPPQSSQGVYIATGDAKQTIGGYPASLWSTSSVPADSEVRQVYEPYLSEDPLVKGFNFDTPSIRRGFIRKVYAILSAQLAITLSFICWFLFDETTKNFVQNQSIVLYVSIGVVFVSLIFLACCGQLRRKAPINYIILILFTLAESVMLGVVTSLFDVDTVALAVGMTAIVCFGLTLFAFQTKFDFTIFGGLLFVSLLLLIVFGIAFACIRTTIGSLLCASLGALLFSAYLVYDTQIMMGGSHKYAISPEEYIFAALNLYVDIINLFLRILIILRHFR